MEAIRRMINKYEKEVEECDALEKKLKAIIECKSITDFYNSFPNDIKKNIIDEYLNCSIYNYEDVIKQIKEYSITIKYFSCNHFIGLTYFRFGRDETIKFDNFIIKVLNKKIKKSVDSIEKQKYSRERNMYIKRKKTHEKFMELKRYEESIEFFEHLEREEWNDRLEWNNRLELYIK